MLSATDLLLTKYLYGKWPIIITVSIEYDGPG